MDKRSEKIQQTRVLRKRKDFLQTKVDENRVPGDLLMKYPESYKATLSHPVGKNHPYVLQYHQSRFEKCMPQWLENVP